MIITTHRPLDNCILCNSFKKPKGTFLALLGFASEVRATCSMSWLSYFWMFFVNCFSGRLTVLRWYRCALEDNQYWLSWPKYYYFYFYQLRTVAWISRAHHLVVPCLYRLFPNYTLDKMAVSKAAFVNDLLLCTQIFPLFLFFLLKYHISVAVCLFSRAAVIGRPTLRNCILFISGSTSPSIEIGSVIFSKFCSSPWESAQVLFWSLSRFPPLTVLRWSCAQSSIHYLSSITLVRA